MHFKLMPTKYASKLLGFVVLTNLTSPKLFNVTGSNLKLAYVHICGVQNDPVFSSGFSSVSDRDFQVYRLCHEMQLALIVVRRGKIKPKEVVNIRFNDLKVVKRLVQTEKDCCGVV